MKTKFLRILSVFAYLAFFIVSPNVNNAFATWKIKNDTLVIFNERAGNLDDNFKAEQFGKYKTLVVKGDVDSDDFLILQILANTCNTLDLSGVRTTLIPRGAFKMMRNLEKVILPISLEVIDEEAFALCSNVIIDTLPKNIKAIKCSAFLGCKKLTLTIPAGVDVGRNAFAYCTNVCLPENLSTTNITIPTRRLSLFSAILSLVGWQ